MLPPETLALAAQTLTALRARAWRVATAESCTGGLIAASLTHNAGSSDVLDCGFVTYSNHAKSTLLGIPPALIETHGAVSQHVAQAMAEGALARAPVHLAISVTGIAGPGGATPGKPVGLVWFGLACRGKATATFSQIFPGDRATIRALTVATALQALEQAADA